MENYPNILRENYPMMAGCPGRNNKEHTIQSFMKFCPANAQVDKVLYYRKFENRCEWHVIYNFEGGVRYQDIHDKAMIIKEPNDVIRESYSLADDNMLKITYSVLSCDC